MVSNSKLEGGELDILSEEAATDEMETLAADIINTQINSR